MACEICERGLTSRETGSERNFTRCIILETSLHVYDIFALKFGRFSWLHCFSMFAFAGGSGLGLNV